MNFLLLPLLLLSVLLTGCTVAIQQRLSNMNNPLTNTHWYQRSKLVVPSGQVVSAYMQYDGYNNVVLDGTFHVEGVKTARRHEPIQFVGDENYISHIQSRVENNTLYIRFNPDYAYDIKNPVTLRLPFQCLNGFTFKGTGDVIIKNLHTRCFNLTLQGNINAWFTGNIVMSNLNFDNDGKLVMHWVNTTGLCINAKRKGTLMLAGIAHQLEINATDAVTVDAKFLRVKTGHIHTQQYARADVTVTQHLNAWAEDKSNIYYYAHPTFMSNASGAGSLIDMGGVHRPYPKELR